MQTDPKNRIYVTKPILPPLEEFVELLNDIWDSKIITNNGKYHQMLEREMANFLGVPYLSLFVNGTLALITALQAFRITGEVITTPYSFVATTHSLWWNNIKPVFVDVDPAYGNLDPSKIEAAITPQTTAILPVHVYGNPCNVEEIERISDIYGLKVIYDAAHTFGVKYKGSSISNFGDLSILSFHATKPFNTIEGGAIVTHDIKTKKRIDDLKNFGFHDEVTVVGPGINAKMNEIQAAYGLLQLKHFPEAVLKRKQIAETYRNELSKIPGIRLIPTNNNIESNYAYFPIFVQKDFPASRDELYDWLKSNNIYGRRYFYPLISNFPTYKGLPSSDKLNLKNANTLSDQVICLPIYPELKMDEVHNCIECIKGMASGYVSEKLKTTSNGQERNT